MSIKSSHVTYLSRQLPTVTFPVNTAQGKKGKTICPSTSSCESWMSVTSTGHAVFHFTSSGSRCSIPTYWKRSGILKKETKDIQSFLRLMELFLTNSPKTFWAWEWIESSGPGEGITLTMRPSLSSKELGWSVYSSKKPRKKSLKSGRRSQGSK